MNGASKRLKKTALAILVLIIPGICYMLLRTGTNYYQSLPFYGPERIVEDADNISGGNLYELKDSLFTRFPGGQAAWDSLDNKMYVASFVRAKTSPEADTLAVNLARLAETYHDLERLRFITFIATDSPSVYTPFEQMLDSYSQEGGSWIRLRVPEEAVRHIARAGFLLHPDPSGGPGSPLSDTVVLVDSRKHIRGYYNGSSYFDTDTLKDEIIVLLKEELNQDDQ